MVEMSRSSTSGPGYSWRRLRFSGAARQRDRGNGDRQFSGPLRLSEGTEAGTDEVGLACPVRDLNLLWPFDMPDGRPVSEFGDGLRVILLFGDILQVWIACRQYLS